MESWMTDGGTTRNRLTRRIHFLPSRSRVTDMVVLSSPHPANPPPDIRGRHATCRIALRELQRGSTCGHRLEPLQQAGGERVVAVEVGTLGSRRAIRSPSQRGCCSLWYERESPTAFAVSSTSHPTNVPLQNKLVDCLRQRQVSTPNSDARPTHRVESTNDRKRNLRRSFPDGTVAKPCVSAHNRPHLEIVGSVRWRMT